MRSPVLGVVCDIVGNAVGAQTERPSAAMAGEGCAWRRELTGLFSYFLTLL